MINKRLLKAVPEIRKYISGILLLNILSLFVNIFMNVKIAEYINSLLINKGNYINTLLAIISALILNIIFIYFRNLYSHNSSQKVKLYFREKLFSKCYGYGMEYADKASSSEIVQLAVGGIEQLDMYFGKFIPQLFYSMTAPVILFIYLSRYSFKVAFILFIFIPLIPVSIMLVQKMARKTMKEYWKSFVNLSDAFLDNLQGLTTLKVYSSDEYINEEMNKQAENFRIATMKVLSVQLNNINIMDLTAYGGSAVGIAVSLAQFQKGNLDFTGTLLFILLAVEFFLPLRLLGSFFHVAMNGMSASDRMFEILDMDDIPEGKKILDDENIDIELKDMSFSYNREKELLNNINMTFKSGEFTTIVGSSGSGKSTIADLIMGIKRGYTGEILFNGEKDDFTNRSKLKKLTLIDNNPYIFEGSVEYNLLMGNPKATREEMWNVLKEVSLDRFLEEEKGLETYLEENGSNLSGGQKQRLGVARALLKDTSVFILDEATSNIDVESEDIIINLFHQLKKDHTVIFISHRLKSSKEADMIYMLKDRGIKEKGTFQQLIDKDGSFKELYDAQTALESFGR